MQTKMQTEWQTCFSEQNRKNIAIFLQKIVNLYLRAVSDKGMLMKCVKSESALVVLNYLSRKEISKDFIVAEILTFTQIRWMDLLILINGMSPLLFIEASGIISQFDLTFFMKFLLSRQYRRYSPSCNAVGDLGLLCLPMSQNQNARLIWATVIILIIRQINLGKQWRPRSDCSSRLLLEEQSDQGLHCLLFHLDLFDKIH